MTDSDYYRKSAEDKMDEECPDGLQVRHCPHHLRELVRELAAQAAEIERLRADAERLEWLWGITLGSASGGGRNEWVASWSFPNVEGAPDGWPDDIRAAIDAARGGEEG